MFHSFPIQKATWLIKPLLACHLIAVLLLGSWLYEPTRIYWDALDKLVFTSLNGLIPLMNMDAARLWAAMCHRKFDLAAALLIAFLTLTPGLWFARGTTWRYALLLFFLFGCIVLIAGNNLGFFHRWSPSMTFEEVNVLPDVGFHTKTRSRDSFPGNHGMVLMAWVLFTWLFAHSVRVKWAVVAIATMLFLPRMTVGAHWLTDNLVGGTSFALIFLAWTCFTPLRAIPVWLADQLSGLVSRIIPKQADSRAQGP